MDRNEILNDIERTFGSVPDFIKEIPDNALEEFWGLMKKVEMSQDTAIPPKYKELIGVAVAGALHCRYCSYFHTEAAKLNGATEDEIKEALLVASLTNLYSTFLNGAQYDLDHFKKEVDTTIDSVKRMMPAGVR